MPISFLALSWLLSADSGSFLGVSGLHFTALAAPALALSWYASSTIFAFLWRGEQRTFLASYLILCVSGALPTLHDSGIALTVSFALWMVATIGAIKINRHIFWMTEEHRLPRAFGFLPILLLGLQFMVLVILKAGAALPVEWIGLGLVLTSSTVLMTARTVADVHRQRTGGNLRPLPWNILAPLMVGVTLSLIGVLVSFYGFSYGPGSTRAVVPTTLLAGAMMFVVARQTNQQAFTWIGLVLITITYQSTPTLVSGLVEYVKSNAASAVGESRLQSLSMDSATFHCC